MTPEAIETPQAVKTLEEIQNLEAFDILITQTFETLQAKTFNNSHSLAPLVLEMLQDQTLGLTSNKYISELYKSH